MNKKHLKFIISIIIILGILASASFIIYTKQKNSENKAALKLVFALDIVRHGDRTPANYIPFFSEHWKNQPKGFLTKKGEEESLNLGKIIGNYYIKERNFLPKQFDEKSIVVKSSNIQRTKKTAEQILQGMYPNSNIEIKSFPEKQDPLLPTDEVFKNIKNSFYNNAPQTIINEIDKVIENINYHLNTNFVRKDIGKIFDNISINEKYNIKRPYMLPAEDYTKIYVLGKMRKMSLTHSIKESCFVSLPIVNNILMLLQTASISQYPKYVLYTTHDIIIMALLKLIDNQEVDPQYLARVQIELFQNLSKELYVKILYNNKPIKPCGTVLCPINKFQTTVLNSIKVCYDIK